MNKVLSTRQQYLKAMGIEVWTRRPASTSAAGPRVAGIDALKQATRPQATAAPDPAPEPAERAGGSPDQVPTPAFRLALFHYGNLGLCLSLAADERTPKRFCDDIARLLGGDVDALRFHDLKWPMLDTPGIDQSAAAAREVVTGKLKSLPARVIVFGDDVAGYFNPLEGMRPLVPGRFGAQDYMLAPAFSVLSDSAAERRKLLRALQPWR